MKAIVLVPMTGPNPAYNRRAAKAAGDAYEIQPVVQFEPGDEIDHPDAHILCCTSPPRCRPADDECVAAVHRFFSDPQRKAKLLKLKQMAQPAVLRTLPKELQEYVAMALPKYRDELQALKEDENAPPPITPPDEDLTDEDLAEFIDDEDADD